MKKSKHDGVLLKIMGLLLTAAALSLTGYNLWGEYQAERNADQALVQVAEAMPETEPEEEYGMQEIESESEKAEIPEFVHNPQMEMPEKVIDGQIYIGVVEIPTLSLKLPVIRDWSDERLKIAPCRYVGSIYTGDLIISGHSYKKHFRYIRKLVEGDPVIFTDMDGNRFVYQVSGTEVIAPDGVEQMVSREWDLTLFTCTYNGSSRHTVRCTLVPEENPWMEYMVER